MWKLPSSPSPVKQILTISNGNGLIYRKAKFSFLRRCHDVPRGQASRMKCRKSTGGRCLARVALTGRSATWPGQNKWLNFSALGMSGGATRSGRQAATVSPPGLSDNLNYKQPPSSGYFVVGGRKSGQPDLATSPRKHGKLGYRQTSKRS